MDSLSAVPGVRHGSSASSTHSVDVIVDPALSGRDRLTCAFRPVLAIPHVLLVGGPAALGATLGARSDRGLEWGTGAGVLGAVAAVAAFIGWFAIVFGNQLPAGLWNLAAFYARWRVRAMAYMTLLTDEYPPFGDGAYPAELVLPAQPATRRRVTVAFRIVLVLPHCIALWILTMGWAITTIAAWLSILFTGEFPESLFRYGVGVLRWSIRVETYLLLLHDDYPPFTLA